MDVRSSTLDGWGTFWQMSDVAFWLLIVLAAGIQAVLVIAPLKWLQLRRLHRKQRVFERSVAHTFDVARLRSLTSAHPDAPGARVLDHVLASVEQRACSRDELLGVARRAIVDEEERGARLMPTLAGLGAASPMLGLFGTVWGIIEAFLKIASEKSSELPIIAPAMSGALLTTALGLIAAIPAVLAYNYLEAQLRSLIDVLDTSAQIWSGRWGSGSLAPVVWRDDATRHDSQVSETL